MGELNRMGMGLPVDVAPHEEPPADVRGLAVEFLANTLNMPGDNRVPINRILQRAHDNPNPSTQMELVHTLHNMLSEDECVGFAERARRSGYFREDESIDLVEAILYDQMSDTDLRDALDIWEEGEIRGAIAGYNDWKYIRAEAFDRLFDFSDTASAAGLMITIAAIFVLRGTVSPGTMFKIGNVGAGIGLVLGLGEALLGYADLDNARNGAERAERLRSIGGGAAMAVTSALPLMISRWGQTGEAIQGINQSGLMQRILGILPEINAELNAMRGATTAEGEMGAARRLVALIEDTQFFLRSVVARTANEMSQIDHMLAGLNRFLVEARGVLSGIEVNPTEAAAAEVAAVRAEAAVGEAIMPVMNGIERAGSWLAGWRQSIQNFLGTASQVAKHAAAIPILLLMGGVVGGGEVPLGGAVGSSFDPRDAACRLREYISNLDKEGLIGRIQETLTGCANNQQRLKYLRQLGDVFEMSWSDNRIQISPRDFLRIVEFVTRQVDEAVPDIKNRGGIGAGIYNTLAPLLRITENLEARLLSEGVLQQEAMVFNRGELAANDTAVYAIAYVHEAMGRLGFYYYALDAINQNNIGSWLSSFGGIIENLFGAAERYAAVGSEVEADSIESFLSGVFQNDLPLVIEMCRDQNMDAELRRLEELSRNLNLSWIGLDVVKAFVVEWWRLTTAQNVQFLSDFTSVFEQPTRDTLSHTDLLRGELTRMVAEALETREPELTGEAAGLVGRFRALAVEAEDYVRRMREVLSNYDPCDVWPIHWNGFGGARPFVDRLSSRQALSFVNEIGRAPLRIRYTLPVRNFLSIDEISTTFDNGNNHNRVSLRGIVDGDRYSYAESYYCVAMAIVEVDGNFYNMRIGRDLLGEEFIITLHDRDSEKVIAQIEFEHSEGITGIINSRIEGDIMLRVMAWLVGVFTGE